MWEESWQDTLPCCGAMRGIGVAAGARQGSRVVGEAGLAGEGLLCPAAPRSQGWVAPEGFLSPTRWHWDPCYGVPVPPSHAAWPAPHPSRGRTVVPMAPLDGEQGIEGPVNCTPALFHWELAYHLGAGVI